MTKDVIVSLQGLQFEENSGGDKVETIIRGEYYNKNGSHFVLYEEAVEGCAEPVKNVLRFGARELNVIKRGSINTHLVFQEHKKSLATYATPFGNIMMGIDAGNFKLREEEEQIVLQVDYAVEINYEYLADCRITIDIRPAAAKVFPFQSGQ